MSYPPNCTGPNLVQRLIKNLLLALFAIMCTAQAQRGDRLNFERELDTGFDALEQNKLDMAKIAFRGALRIQPESAEATCYLGLAEYKSGNMLAAIEGFERAMQLDENIADSPFLYYRALAARNLGLLSHETRAWKQLIEFSPNSRFSERAREALAEMPDRQKFGPDIYFDKGRELAPSYPQAAVLFFVQSIEESLLERRPAKEYELAMSWLLTYLNRTRQPDQVLEMEAPVNAIGSGLENIYLQLAIARVSVGDCDKAETLLGSVTEQRFPNAKAEVSKTCRDVRRRYSNQFTLEATSGGPAFRLEQVEPSLFSRLTKLGEPEQPPTSGATP